MCYGGDRLPAKDDVIEIRPAENENIAAAENLIGRLAETEARLERARAREAELSRQLDEMKKFVVVMEIVEAYLRRRYREQQDHLVRLYSSPSSLLPSTGKRRKILGRIGFSVTHNCLADDTSAV